MGDVKDLTKTAAVEKLQELIKDANTCMFVTNLSSLPLTARPMGTQEVDDAGNIWFLSKNTSDKNIEISDDNRVQLFYANKSGAEYLSIYGHAEILTEQQKINELWTPIAKAWFTEGKDDPSISVIKVKPADAYYWDTKDNKMISLIKIAVSAITGKTMDGGVEGKIKV
jgi:general stress protein 26